MLFIAYDARMITRLIVMAVAFFVTLVASAQSIERYELSNGVRVMYVEVADAPRQTIFTFLPLTLCNDDAGRTQWAHLMEHMLIRSTDPDSLNVPGAMLNGETMHHAMRLETFCEPEKWKENLDRHARWIAARQFSPTTLAREKLNIQGEEQSTAQRGFTSKWAMAAWNQAVRHSQTDVKLHGDVAQANIDDVMAYAKARVPIDETVLIASVGPAQSAEFRAEVERVVGALPKARVRVEDVKATLKPAGAQINATWDMPTRHAMWWWRLPDSSPRTLAGANCLGTVVRVRMRQLANHEQLFRMFSCYSAVPTPEGTYFVVDATLPASVADDAAAKTLAESIWTSLHKQLLEIAASGPKYAPAVYGGLMMASELNLHPKFAAMRKMMSRNVELIEGTWLLNIALTEYTLNLPVEEVDKSLRALDVESLKALLDQLTLEEPGSLLLNPAADAAAP